MKAWSRRFDRRSRGRFACHRHLQLVGCRTTTFHSCRCEAMHIMRSEDFDRFRLPEGVNARLQSLLDRQDAGEPLSVAERAEAEGLVKLAELLTLLRLRAERPREDT